MKKITMFAAFAAAVALMSCGGNRFLAHAETTTDTAALQQQLDTAKAQLIKLQMEAGQVPAGDSMSGQSSAQPTITVTQVTATAALSPADASAMKNALGALSSLLVSLQSKIAENPQFATANGPTVISALQGIAGTIASIGNEVTNPSVAMTAPQTGSTSGGAIAQTNPSSGSGASVAPATPSAPVNPAQPTVVAPSEPTGPSQSATPSQPTTPSNVNTAPQTAQASSAFSFSKLNWPLIVVIILIIAAIAIWLWWDDGDDAKQPISVRVNSPAPQKPMQQPLQTTQSMNSSAQTQKPATSPTPLSSAVAPHGNR